MKVALVNASNNSVVVEFTVAVALPIDSLFVKDRKTKQKYVLVRSKGTDTTQTPRQLIPVPWDQYTPYDYLETSKICTIPRQNGKTV